MLSGTGVHQRGRIAPHMQHNNFNFTSAPAPAKETFHGPTSVLQRKRESSAHLVEHLGFAVAELVEEGLVRGALLHGIADLVEIFRARQLVVAVRVEQPKVAVQLAPVIARQLRPNAVQRYIQRPPVRLQHKTRFSSVCYLIISILVVVWKILG